MTPSITCESDNTSSEDGNNEDSSSTSFENNGVIEAEDTSPSTSFENNNGEIEAEDTSPSTSFEDNRDIEACSSMQNGGRQSTLNSDKYYNPFKYKRKGDRPISIINNKEDFNISNSRIGASYSYNSTELDGVHRLRSQAVFDRSLVSLTLSIPQEYIAKPIGIIDEQKERLIQILRREIAKDDLVTFGFFIEIIILMNKKKQGK